MSSKPKGWGTGQLEDALRLKYPKDAYALFFEVRDSTGYSGKQRAADAVALGLWPSRGHELFGFEIKASRSDWLGELKRPEKAEAVCQFCDRWWIVAAPGVVKEVELPPTWGLMVPRGDSLVVKVQAPQITPKPMSLGFIASLFREAQRHDDAEQRIEREVERQVLAERKRILEVERMRSDQIFNRLEKTEEAIQTFERASGVRITGRWGARQSPKEVGDAVRFVLAGGLDPLLKRLALLQSGADEISRSVAQVLATMPAGKPKIRQPVV